MPPTKVSKKKTGKKRSGSSKKKSKGSKKSTPRMKEEPAPNAAPPPPAENLCIYHGKPLIYFCENVDEPICYDCTVMGPYNTPLHRILSIDDAY